MSNAASPEARDVAIVLSLTLGAASCGLPITVSGVLLVQTRPCARAIRGVGSVPDTLRTHVHWA